MSFFLAQAGSQGKIERSWLLLGEGSKVACVRLPRLHLSPLGELGGLPERDTLIKPIVSNVLERRGLELQSKLYRGVH